MRRSGLGQSMSINLFVENFCICVIVAAFVYTLISRYLLEMESSGAED